MFEFFDNVIKKHEWENVTYIEPYAGGAGAAISLLLLEKVQRLVINDYDKAIYSFWKAVTERNAEFLDLIDNTPVTIEEWEKQKLVYKVNNTDNYLALGFATFFLNRTNRSGIMNAGPIGGKDQSGNYKINARYNKESLKQKIRLIGLYSGRITVLNLDGSMVIDKYADKQNSFFYIDPPYFVKGADLYLNAFKYDDHKKLADTIHKYPNSKWVLSYDNEQQIVDLYPNFNQRVFDLKYSAHQNSRIGSELMVFSDSIDMKIIDEL